MSMAMSFIIFKNQEYWLDKTPRELMERFTNFAHLSLLLMSLTKLMCFSEQYSNCHRQNMSQAIIQLDHGGSWVQIPSGARIFLSLRFS